MRRWSLVMLSLLCFTGSGVVLAADLDGTAWRISEKGKTDTEDLIFVNGQFTSSGCIPYGFLTAPYSVSKAGDSVNFNTTVTNKDNEKMVWSGQAKGNEIKGSYVYTDKKGKVLNSEWSGKKLEAK